MGNAAPAADADKFIETLKNSQLLSTKDMEWIEGVSQSTSDVVALARALIKAEKITKWQAGQLARGFRQFQVGKYTLQDQINSNETGRVYLAEHGKLGRKVALKLLSRRVASDPQVVKRFLAEARIAAAIDHRSIMHVFDVDRDNDQVFVVTEYIDGKQLGKFVEVNKPALRQALAIFSQLIEGMTLAHEKGVVHGGLRPSTILVDGVGNVKICDLGVASLAEPGDTSVDESTEMAIDALQYAAPERVNAPPSVGADIYSLGGIFYLLLTGQTFKTQWRTHELKKSKDVSKEIFLDLRQRLPDAPNLVLKVCAVMLAPNPAERPKSCRDVAKAVTAMLQELASGKETPRGSFPAVEVETPSATPADAGSTDTKSIQVNKTMAGNTPAKTAAKGPAKSPAKPLPRAKPLPAMPRPAANAPNPLVMAPPSSSALDIQPLEEASQTPLIEAEEADGAEPELLEEAVEETVGGLPGFAIDTGAAASSGGGFSINTSAPAAKSGGMAIQTKTVSPSLGKAAVATDSATTSPAAAGPKSNLPLILGLSIGGGVLALAGIVGAVLFFSGGGKKQVAETKEPPVAEQPADGVAAENNPGESNPGETNPGESNPGETNPGEVNPGNPAPMVNPMVANIPPAEPVNPVVPENPATVPDAAVPPATDPAAKPEDEKPKGANPETPPAVKPKPADPKKPAPKPPVKKPEPPKADPEPFKGFPVAVQLPSLGTKDAVPEEALKETKLGPAVLSGLDCYVDLYGGEFAFKGKQLFVLEPANNGTSTNEWEVTVQASENSANSVLIAKFMAKDNAFFFQWQPAAVENFSAPNLCNCVLTLRAGKGTHELRLRTPVIGEPLNVTSTKTTGRWNIDFPPDPEHVKLEFLGAEGPIPNTRFDPKEVQLGGEPPLLWFGNTDTNMPLAAQFRPILGRQFQMDGLFLYKTEKEPKPVPFVRKKLEMGYGQAMQMIQGINRSLEAQKQNKTADQKKQLDALAAQAIEEANKVAAAYQDAATLHDSLKDGVRVNFRVIYMAEDGKPVELLTTKGG